MKGFRSMFTHIRNRLRDRKGQTTMEYVLILAIVFILALQIKQKLGASMSRSVGLIDAGVSTWEAEMQQSGGSGN